MLRGTVLAAGLLACATTHAQEPRRFHGGTDLVVLQVTVTDSRGRTVSGLDASAFTIFDDGQPQVLSVFRGDDVPATVGLVLDDSISMFAVRDLLIAGAVAFAGASHPGDEIFALAFNESVRAALPDGMPFTRDPSLLRRALEGVVTTRGKTALYDAIAAGVDYARAGSHQRKALVVVSDGGDNASVASFEGMLARTRASNVVIHSVLPNDDAAPDAKPKVMRRLADETGGHMFTARTPRDIARVLSRVAIEVRRGYTLGFVPPTPPDTNVRTLRVAVSAPGHGPLTARTRSGYLRVR